MNKQETMDKIKGITNKNKPFKIYDDALFAIHHYGNTSDGFINLMENFYDRDLIIIPGEIQEALTTNIESIYDALEPLCQEKIISPFYKFFCCDEEGEAFETFSEIPEEITCKVCGKVYSIVLKNIYVFFRFI